MKAFDYHDLLRFIGLSVLAALRAVPGDGISLENSPSGRGPEMMVRYGQSKFDVETSHLAA